MKIAKPKIVDPCELCDTNNVSLTSEMVCDYKRDNFKEVISPPVFINNSVDLMNHSEAQKKVTIEGRISGCFYSDNVFNLSHRVLTETEIKVLEKGWDYAPIQKKINEPEFRKDFSEFCWRMRNKWYFRNEPTPQFSEVPCFKTKSSWRLPNDHPALEIFLFDICTKQQTYSILTVRNEMPYVL